MNSTIKAIINSDMIDERKALRLYEISNEIENVELRTRILNFAKNLDKTNKIIDLELKLLKGSNLKDLFDDIIKNIGKQEQKNKKQYVYILNKLFKIFLDEKDYNYIREIINDIYSLNLDYEDCKKIYTCTMSAFYMLGDNENSYILYKKIESKNDTYSLVCKLIYYLECKDKKMISDIIIKLADKNPYLLCYYMNIGETRELAKDSYCITRFPLFMEAIESLNCGAVALYNEYSADTLNVIITQDVVFQKLFAISELDLACIIIACEKGSKDIYHEVLSSYGNEYCKIDIDKSLNRMCKRHYIVIDEDSVLQTPLFDILMSIVDGDLEDE